MLLSHCNYLHRLFGWRVRYFSSGINMLKSNYDLFNVLDLLAVRKLLPPYRMKNKGARARRNLVFRVRQK